MAQATQELRAELRNRVLARTGRRVKNLEVQFNAENIVLLGQAGSFHVKQLAQQGIQEFLPSARLKNAIIVA